jgi:hypothetical protein
MIRRSIQNYGRSGTTSSTIKRKTLDTSTSSSKTTQTKKQRSSGHKKDSESFLSTSKLPGYAAPSAKEILSEQAWNQARLSGERKVERWIERFRLSRQSYWEELLSKSKNKPKKNNFYLTPESPTDTLTYKVCSTTNKKRKYLVGDELMQCLGCSFMGGSPKSISQDSHQSMMQHMLLSGHEFGK